MDFQGPLPADYENVRTLNRAFLDLLKAHDRARAFLRTTPGELAIRLQRLTRRQIEWLAATPFLLFSFRERDDDYWQELLRQGGSQDLFSITRNPADDAGRVAAAGLGFVWQLANRNPFAARLVCGASTYWCEQIAELTLYRLLTMAAHRADLLMLRAADDADLWHKLLSTGLSEKSDTRTAAHISAMQYVLTRHPHRTVWQAAACTSRNPAFQVAEDSNT
jgi:hypothetical protein